jgi:hypothetical protein
MKEQNFKNHVQLVTGYHRVTLVGILLFLVASVNYLIKSTPENKYLASMLFLLSLVIVLMAWYLRIFALKAQDRAIRAEENLRHFVLTGKLLPSQLRMGQIIALRFAPDAEFLVLVEKAVKENLSNKDIKLAIQNWKADFDRV